MAITTGPFRVPSFIAGTPPVSTTIPNQVPTRLIINLKNPTTTAKIVTVQVHVCPSPPAPAPGTSCVFTAQTVEAPICNLPNITLTSDRCRQVFVTVIPGNIYRVTVIGDVDDDAEEVEVSVVGTNASLQYHEPSMFFRHEDFIEVD